MIRGKQTDLLVQVLASSDCSLDVSEPMQIGGVTLRRLTAHAYWILRHPDFEETSRVQFVTLLVPYVKGENRPKVLVHKTSDLLAAQVEKGNKLRTLLFSQPRVTRPKLEVFGITTDARACLVCQNRQGLQAILVLNGSQVTVEGQRIFSARRHENYCWTKED